MKVFGSKSSTVSVGQVLCRQQQRSFFSKIWSGSTSTTTAASPSAVDPASSSSSSSFSVVEKVMLERRTCRVFDQEKEVPAELLDKILGATVRSPTGFNLQGWTCVVVRDPLQRQRLQKAALSQPAVGNAPVTVVFAGDKDPSVNAPLALEMGINSSYYRPSYGAMYLRAINYMLHSGPHAVMNKAKYGLSSWYSHATGSAQLTVPTTMEAYAWKQVMIPATNFITLCNAAGLGTCPLEGIDEAQVMDVVGLPSDKYTVPLLVSCGYPTLQKDVGAYHPVPSPRFDRSHFVHADRYTGPR